jgi:hypothetical protein
MKMKSNEFVKKLKRHLSAPGQVHDKKLIHPVREWYVGLAVGGILLMGTIAWSIAIYFENKNLSMDQMLPESEGSIVYREEMVREALLVIDKKAATLANIETSETATVFGEVVVPEPESELMPISSTTASSSESTSEIEVTAEQDNLPESAALDSETSGPNAPEPDIPESVLFDDQATVPPESLEVE